MRHAVIVVTAAAIASHAAAVAGQVRVVRAGDDRLVGITQVDVVVVTAPPAGPCSLARQPLQAAAVSTLAAAGIPATVSEKGSSWFYSVTMDLTSAAAGDGCATAITIELIAQVQGVPDADAQRAPQSWGSLLVGAMPLIRVHDLVTTPAKEHDAAVARAVDRHIAALSARVRAVNP